MERLMFLVVGLSFLLAGCSSQAEMPISEVTDTNLQTEVIAQPTTEALQENSNFEGDFPQNPKPDRKTIIRLYKEVIEREFSKLPKETGSVQYSLYDTNNDGIPELFLNHGTYEYNGEEIIDEKIDIYTCDNSGLNLIESGIDGAHARFAYDYTKNQLVLVVSSTAVQCYWSIHWLNFDEYGKIHWLESTGSNVGYVGEVQKLMEENDIDYLPASTIHWKLDDKGEFATETYLFGSQYEYPVYPISCSGSDYTLLESYPFYQGVH